MSYETVPTITILRNGDPVRINASDYVEGVDELASGQNAPEAAQDENLTNLDVPTEPTPVLPENAPQPVQLGLVKKGRKYFVVNAGTGEPVEMDGIDSDGYSTEAAAVEAAQAAMVA